MSWLATACHEAALILPDSRQIMTAQRDCLLVVSASCPQATADSVLFWPGRCGEKRCLMKYKVAIYRTDEGISVTVPALPGCWSEGDTEEEALANIQDAIRAYLAVLEDELAGAEVREVEVAG